MTPNSIYSVSPKLKGIGKQQHWKGMAPKFKGNYFWMIVNDFNYPLIFYSIYSTMLMYAFHNKKNKIKKNSWDRNIPNLLI